MTEDQIIVTAIKKAKEDAVAKWPALANEDFRRKLVIQDKLLLQAFLQERGEYWVEFLSKKTVRVDGKILEEIIDDSFEQSEQTQQGPRIIFVYK